MDGPITRYAAALAIFAVAAAFRVMLEVWLPATRAPYITFFPAVVSAAYLCGLGPGMLVLGLSLPASWYFWHEEAMPIRLTGSLVFAALAASILYIIDRLHRTVRDLEARDQQLLVINRELQHRLKNLFAITSAISIQTIRARLPIDETIAAVSGRIGSVAAAQDLLGVTATDGATLEELISALVVPLSPAPERLTVSGPSQRLAGDDSTPFALILHELATNAVKHGAWSQAAGIVDISWTTDLARDGGGVEFVWTERNGPGVATPTRNGLGIKLIKSALPTADVACTFASEGFSVLITLPGKAGPTLRPNRTTRT